MICYLVAPTEADGIADANGRGWTRLAALRFATPARDDVRVVCRASELVPMAGRTPMIKGASYDDGPSGALERRRWFGDETMAGDKAKFDEFVSRGNGEWVDV